jgi:hypothetical protein
VIVGAADPFALTGTVSMYYCAGQAELQLFKYDIDLIFALGDYSAYPMQLFRSSAELEAFGNAGVSRFELPGCSVDGSRSCRRFWNFAAKY